MQHSPKGPTGGCRGGDSRVRRARCGGIPGGVGQAGPVDPELRHVLVLPQQPEQLRGRGEAHAPVPFQRDALEARVLRGHVDEQLDVFVLEMTGDGDATRPHRGRGRARRGGGAQGCVWARGLGGHAVLRGRRRFRMRPWCGDGAAMPPPPPVSARVLVQEMMRTWTWQALVCGHNTGPTRMRQCAPPFLCEPYSECITGSPHAAAQGGGDGGGGSQAAVGAAIWGAKGRWGGDKSRVWWRGCERLPKYPWITGRVSGWPPGQPSALDPFERPSPGPAQARVKTACRSARSASTGTCGAGVGRNASFLKGPENGGPGTERIGGLGSTAGQRVFPLMARVHPRGSPGPGHDRGAGSQHKKEGRPTPEHTCHPINLLPFGNQEAIKPQVKPHAQHKAHRCRSGGWSMVRTSKIWSPKPTAQSTATVGSIRENNTQTLSSASAPMTAGCPHSTSTPLAAEGNGKRKPERRFSEEWRDTTARSRVSAAAAGPRRAP